MSTHQHWEQLRSHLHYINMKKTIITTIAVILSYISNAQIKTEKISKLILQGMACNYEKKTNLDNNQTEICLYLMFQNREYTSITDLKIIGFFIKDYGSDKIDSALVLNFLKDLKIVYKEMGNNASLEWQKERYTLRLLEKIPDLFIEKNDGGYTHITKAEVEKLIDWIQSLGFNIG